MDDTLQPTPNRDALMTLLAVLLLKAVFVPAFAFLYWLVAVKGGELLASLLFRDLEARRFFTKDRWF